MNALKPGKWVHIVCALILFGMSLPVSSALAEKDRAAQQADNYVFDVRYIELAEQGVEGLTGLAYSPRADILLAVHDQGGNNRRSVAMLDREENLIGSAGLEAQLADSLILAFNGLANSMFTFDPARQELAAIPADDSGVLPGNAAAAARYNLRGASIQHAQGMAFDPVSGRLFFLDAAGKRLVILTPDTAGDYDADRASRENRVSRVDLNGIGANHLRGLAYNPNSGNLFTIGQDSLTLYEITQQGALVSIRDMSSFDLMNPAGLVFAPSGDSTDDPSTESLYVADTGTNMIAEISITAVALAALPSASPISLVNTILAYNWNPPAPDTSGLSYNPFTNQLFVSDSEVEEMTIYQGKNVFQSSLGGNLQATCVTTSFTKEPAGLAVNTDNGNIYFSDDGKKFIYEVHLGPDGKYCTGDDFVTSTDVRTYGVGDPEGIEFGNGKIYIADGKNAEVYVVSLGPNGILDGAPPQGDDTSIHWDTSSLGLRAPEGIGFQPVRGTLMIVSRGDKILLETSINGSVQRVFDIGFSNILKPAGVGVGTGSNNSSGVHVYIAQRGVDNNSDPNENDGKIFEFDVGDFYGAPPPPTPIPDLIFADGFESGSFSAWSSSTTGGGDLRVTSGAALVGSRGMQALINDNGAIFVTDETPFAEPRYRARFHFDPNSISMVSGDNHFIFSGFSGTSKAVLRIQFRFSKGAYQVRAQILNNSSNWTNTSWFTISDAPHVLEIDWLAATSAGANDGGLTLWIDGVQRAAVVGIANGNYRIDRVQLGALNGIDAGTSGSNYFDAFESHRQTYIGP